MIMDLGYTYHCRVFVKSFLGPLDIPGEFEQEAMAAGAMRILTGEEKLKIYPGKPVWEGFGQ